MRMLKRKTKRKAATNKTKSKKAKQCFNSTFNLNKKISSNLLNYILDFFDIDDYFQFFKVDKKFKAFIEKKKAFTKFINTMKTLQEIKEEFLESIFYHKGSLDFFASNEIFSQSEKTKIYHHIYSRIFSHSVNIRLSQMSSDGFKNLEIILKDEKINITNFQVKLNYIHFYHFDKIMKKFLIALKDCKTIKNLEVIDISRGHSDYFREMLLRNKKIQSLTLKVKNEKLHNFEFDFLNDKNNIKELKIIGRFSEFEKTSFMILIENKKFLSLDFSESENLACYQMLKTIVNWKNLKMLNIENYPLETKDLKMLLTIVENNFNMKLKIVDKERSKNKRLYNKIVNNHCT